MPRRLLVPHLTVGELKLPDDQAHHARDVLRLTQGTQVELFTPTGQTAAATLIVIDPSNVIASIASIEQAASPFQLTIASAVPKAARADWMVEKLSELGVARFIPLATDRSVVHPEGKNKIDRWQRLAAESAKQSHRTGVMQISPLTPLNALLQNLETLPVKAILSTAHDADPLPSILNSSVASLLLLIGPEGGWTPDELSRCANHALTPLTLGATILRVETAAIAAAAVVAALVPKNLKIEIDP